VNIERILLLDGGMGRELRARGVEILDTIWSANALLTAPDVVRQVHRDYIDAGADVITTNTYGVIRHDLAKEGIEHRFAELNRLACDLTRQARDDTDKPVLIAGSLPPLRGSYRPDLVEPFDVIEPLYREQAEILAPHVDVLLCETMSCAAEALAAATAAASTSLPVWVSFTLRDDGSGLLRSGESVAEAVTTLNGLPIQGVLANCCPPESISAAMDDIVATGQPHVGGYANTFLPVPEGWTLDGAETGDGLLPLRDDLDSEAYARYVRAWLEHGATVVGGCCGTGPAHIARLRQLIDSSTSGSSTTRQ
jgi:S-methylmethionine-dependent homocysteine/selenocysteine methylase